MDVPQKHFDSGSTRYHPSNPFYSIHLWARSLADEDRERVERARNVVDWAEVRCPIVPGSAKHFNVNTAAWYEYITGANPAFPVRALEANIALIEQQMHRMRSTDGDPHRFDSIHHIEGHTEAPDLQIDGYAIHIWQEFNPVYFESLVQLMWGAPMPVYHWGCSTPSCVAITPSRADRGSRMPRPPSSTPSAGISWNLNSSI